MKKYFRIICFFLFLVLGIGFFQKEVKAVSKNKLRNVKEYVEKYSFEDELEMNKGNTTEYGQYDLEEDDDEPRYDAFNLNMKNCRKVVISSEVKSNSTRTQFRLAGLYIFKMTSDNMVENTIFASEKVNNSYVSFTGWLDQGKYIIVVENYVYENWNDNYEEEPNDGKYCRTVKVQNITSCDGKVEINKKKMKINRLDYGQVALSGTSKTIKWKSSNKKIVTVDKKGNILAKKTGKAKIYTTVNGKRYQCVVEVLPMKVDFTANLISYDTRSNSFIISVTNNSKSTLRFFSNGAYSQDKDYTKYDRQLQISGGNEYIDIKPRQTKRIRFNVIGELTWPNVEDHTVFCTFEFEKKKYFLKTSYWSGYYSSNKKNWKYVGWFS